MRTTRAKRTRRRGSRSHREEADISNAALDDESIHANATSQNDNSSAVSARASMTFPAVDSNMSGTNPESSGANEPRTVRQRTRRRRTPSGISLILQVKQQWSDRRSSQRNESSESDQMADEESGEDESVEHEEGEEESMIEVTSSASYVNNSQQAAHGASPGEVLWVTAENSDTQLAVEDEPDEPADMETASAWEPNNTVEAELVRVLIASKVVNEENRKRAAMFYKVACAVTACFVVAGIIGLVLAIYVSLDGSKKSITSVSNPGETFDAEAGPSFFRKATQCFGSEEELRETLYRYVVLQDRLAKGSETEEDTWDRASIGNTFGWPIGEWCTSKITTLRSVFSPLSFDEKLGAPPAEIEKFNEDISRWDVSRVTDFGYAFSNLMQFNQPLNSWNVSSALGMVGTFLRCLEFDQPLHDWNVSKVVKFAKAFYEAEKFNQDLSAWDVSEANVMGAMFAGAFQFNQPLNSWKVTNVKFFYRTFENSRKFDQDLSAWDVSGADDMGKMFSGAHAFNGNIARWNVSRVTTMNQMFMSAEDFNVDLSSWRVSQVVDFDSTFFGAKSFSRDLCSWGPMLDDLNGVSMSGMFTSSGCNVTHDPIVNASPVGPWCAECG